MTKRLFICLLVGGLAALVWFSFRLASVRIYQVDECMEVYVAKVLATNHDKAAAGHVTLFQVALSCVVRAALSSVDSLVFARAVMLEIFWLNLALIALASSGRLLSPKGLIAFLGAATLAPLWDYGFEVRHDNLLLTGLLLTWCVVRVRPAGPRSYFIAGAIAVGLQFVAFKAFAYTVPLSLVILAFPPPGHNAPRWKLASAWALGAIGVFLAVRLTFEAAGLWDLYLGGCQFLSKASTGGRRFGAEVALGRLLSQTPLLLALLATALVTEILYLRRRGKAALNWEGNLPEVLLFVISFTALIINPAPFPYNLLHLVPYAFVLAFRYASKLATEVWDRPALLPVTGAILVFAHLVPFGIATRRHLNWTNFRQERLIALAEKLTDPAKDPVYDAIGMVPTRRVIDPHAFLHSLNFESFVNGSGPQVRDMLAARPAPVFIPNYRTDWLPEADHAFIRERYVSLADDFWVLGKLLPAGGGTFEIIHPGRYRISTSQGSDLSGTYPGGLEAITTPEEEGRLTGTLDGVPVSNRPVELARGIHRIECVPDQQPAVVWVGPRLERIHRLSPGDHRLLFYNWY